MQSDKTDTYQNNLERHKEIGLSLWKKLIDGDINALGNIYDIYVDDLFTYGVQISDDKNYVMDCIHDLFLDLYKYKAKLAHTDNVKFYLLKSLKRKIFRKQPAKIIPISYDSTSQKHAIEDYSNSIEEDIIAAENLDDSTLKLTNAISLLSKKQKLALSLRYNEEKQYEEIAQIMNVSLQTSRTIIYRTIKALKKHLISFLLISATLI